MPFRLSEWFFVCCAGNNSGGNAYLRHYEGCGWCKTDFCGCLNSPFHYTTIRDE